jgi:hypothetical protein
VRVLAEARNGARHEPSEGLRAAQLTREGPPQVLYFCATTYGS